MIQLDVEGVDLTTAALSGAARKIRKKVLGKAVRAGAAPYVKAVRREAPVDTRELKRNLTQKVKSYQSGARIVSIVGARNRRSPAGRNPAKYLHLVEGGTKPHVIRTRTARSLALGGGAFARQVNHPGTRPARLLSTKSNTERSSMINAFHRKMIDETNKELAT